VDRKEREVRAVKLNGHMDEVANEVGKVERDAETADRLTYYEATPDDQ
jgi:hypothetical protein